MIILIFVVQTKSTRLFLPAEFTFVLFNPVNKLIKPEAKLGVGKWGTSVLAPSHMGKPNKVRVFHNAYKILRGLIMMMCGSLVYCTC